MKSWKKIENTKTPCLSYDSIYIYVQSAFPLYEYCNYYNFKLININSVQSSIDLFPIVERALQQAIGFRVYRY